MTTHPDDDRAAGGRPRRRHRASVAVLLVGLVAALLPVARADAAKPFTAPGDLQESGVTRSQMVLTWAAVPGAPGYRVRATSSGNAAVVASTTTNRVTLTGLQKDTRYSVRAYVEQPESTEGPAAVLSDASPAAVVATSDYARQNPAGLVQGRRTSTTVQLSWAPVADLADGERYLLTYSLDTEGTVSPRTAGPFSKPSAKLTGLRQDTTYFVRVHVVDADGKRVSGSSELVTAKTLIPRGTITGTTTGAPPGDLLVVAYTSGGEAAGQTPLRSDGRYTLQVRPGTYTVQVQYLGLGGLVSRWATAGRAGSTVRSQATPVKVALGATVAAPAVRVTKGATVSGLVKGPDGAVVRDVDVTALSAVTSEREVVASTRSGSTYTLKGLPDGAYRLRFVYSGDGFAVRTITTTVSGGRASVVDARLATAPFRSAYKPRISGTKRVGRTLTATVTPWLAGSYPTTRAAMSLQWLRDGKAVRGATGTRYTLTKADRGAKVGVRATARRYGYTTASRTSTAYRVS